MNYLEVEHLQKHFGEVQVLKDISFSVKPGEVGLFLLRSEKVQER